ncbi:hypothetical protein [Conexibacter sp. CPCC 206217]|uniref:hypothetical protein n=1 Tax=Conexibacter sp. CPCC 206217 TaxID=3064574 RepID=UPI00271F94F4|nr:hypothetical protein [Conexibacter sp. CPCC 206217]MDO8209943.1 hypothetical protein [Conexibacter sp. CPCC 206217]
MSDVHRETSRRAGRTRAGVRGPIVGGFVLAGFGALSRELKSAVGGTLAHVEQLDVERERLATHVEQLAAERAQLSAERALLDRERARLHNKIEQLERRLAAKDRKLAKLQAFDAERRTLEPAPPEDPLAGQLTFDAVAE